MDPKQHNAQGWDQRVADGDVWTPVWAECARVSRSGGHLLAGFMNPITYIFDQRAEARGELTVRFPLPYFPAAFATGARKEEALG